MKSQCYLKKNRSPNVPNFSDMKIQSALNLRTKRWFLFIAFDFRMPSHSRYRLIIISLLLVIANDCLSAMTLRQAVHYARHVPDTVLSSNV